MLIGGKGKFFKNLSFVTAFIIGILFLSGFVRADTLDNFDSQSLVSSWWTTDSLEPYVYNLDFANTEYVHSGTKSLKVIYNKANDSNAYSAFCAMGGLNLKNYDYLSFWVYNEGSVLTFNIRFEDVNGVAWEMSWAGMELPSTVTPQADWENLVVDLTRTFGDTSGIDWTQIKQVIFMVQPGDATATGTFWMDDIVLNRAPNSSVLESFENDFYGWSASGAFSLNRTADEFQNGGGTTDLGNHSLKVTWTTKDADYSNFTYDTQHDSTNASLNRIGNYPDFTLNDNKTLELWVKSTTDNNFPILLKFDSTDVGTQYYTSAGAWQKLYWDYSAVTGASNVTTVYIFPYPGQSDDGGSLYIDNLNLTGGNAPLVPTAPEGFRSNAAKPDGDGYYSISWYATNGANNYQLQEATDLEFSNPISYYPSGVFLNITKDPATEAGTYYYRVRSNIQEGTSDNYGNFTKPIVVNVNSEATGIRNQSYSTLCAEVDNINIPLWQPDVTHYRITAIHPAYYPTSINERGADWSDCEIPKDDIWIIGTDDDSSDEFKQSGFSGYDEYFALDDPPAGTDEPVSEFPKEINSDWMNDQYIRFTAEEETEVNIEAKIGANLTVDFANINGTLEIKAYTWDGSGWIDHGSKIFDSANKTQTWNFPDGTWIEGVDANNIHLDVVTASEGGQSTPGAWGVYDYLKLVKREVAGDTPTTLYDDGNVIVEGVNVDFWWRWPESMSIDVIGGNYMAGAQYLRISKKIPGKDSYPQFFVLYEDGNARIIPLPPDDIDWVPFGSSVILGPTADAQRPFADIDAITVDPIDLSLDITYKDGSIAHVELRADTEQTIVDVDGITYNISDYPFARFRSMWVTDGKADIDTILTQDGQFPILGNWSNLEGNWWFFNKRVPTYHNTYCPDLKLEILEPSPAFLTRQAESLDSGTGYQISWRDNAVGNQAISMSVNGGEAIYNINLDKNYPQTYLLLRYSDEDGGNNGDILGNTVEIYVDGVLKAQTTSVRTGGWDSFEFAPALSLGDLVMGQHEIKIVTGSGTFGIDLDEFKLISQPVPRSVGESILTRQAETLDSGSGYQIGYRSNAVGGQTIIMSANGGEAIYNVNIPATYKNTYIEVRYADDVGPNKVEVYLDGSLAGKFPSESTGGWNTFETSSGIYLGTLTSGAHEIKLVTSAETYGIDLDQFELISYAPIKATIEYVNPDHYDVNGVPVWYIGETMNYQVYLQNLDTQSYSSLDVQTIQEYNETTENFSKGDTLPGDSIENWLNQNIPVGGQLVLSDDYYISPEAYPAYNQTHLILKEAGVEIYNDDEAGVWCPPPIWEPEALTVKVDINPKVINSGNSSQLNLRRMPTRSIIAPLLSLAKDKPTTRLETKSQKDIITAIITLPEDRKAKEVNLLSLTLNGSYPLKVKAVGKNRLVAKFKRNDLYNLVEGENVTLTISGEFLDGKAFKGKGLILVK
jgi:hypothetical protein